MAFSVHDGVSYERFDERDTEGTADLLARAFTARDPPAVATGLTHADFVAFVRLLCPGAAGEGLSVVARAVDSGEVIGALIAENPARGGVLLPERLARAFAPILQLLGELEADYTIGRAAPHPLLHIFLIGVDKQWCGRGVGRTLISHCLANGRALGYRFVVTEATSKRSQRLFASERFTVRATRSYADYRFEGAAVFSSIAQEGGPMLMDRPIESE